MAASEEPEQTVIEQWIRRLRLLPPPDQTSYHTALALQGISGVSARVAAASPSLLPGWLLPLLTVLLLVALLACAWLHAWQHILAWLQQQCPLGVTLLWALYNGAWRRVDEWRAGFRWAAVWASLAPVQRETRRSPPSVSPLNRLQRSSPSPPPQPSPSPPPQPSTPPSRSPSPPPSAPSFKEDGDRGDSRSPSPPE